MDRVLLTGGTGSLGRYLALELLAGGSELVLGADVTQRDLGLGRAEARLLAREVDGIVHAAATGTANVLAFARRVPRLRKLVHVSTAFVAGRRCGRILEHELLHEAGFVNAYERSQYEAEELVRGFHTVLPIAVVRPSIVVEPGEKVFGPVASGPPRLVSPLNRLDLISATDAAAAIATAFRAPDGLGTFHICAGDRAPVLRDVVDAAALAYPKIFDTTAAEALLGGPPCRTDPLALLEAWRQSARFAAGGRL